MKHSIIPHLAITFAICTAFAGANAAANPPKRYVASTDWELRLETRTDVYVLDHGMTIGDCGERAMQIRPLIRRSAGDLVCARNIRRR